MQSGHVPSGRGMRPKRRSGCDSRCPPRSARSATLAIASSALWKRTRWRQAVKVSCISPSNRRASVRAEAPAFSDHSSSVRMSEGSSSRPAQTRASRASRGIGMTSGRRCARAISERMQRHDRAAASGAVVEDRLVDQRQDQLAQQIGDRHHGRACGQISSRVARDVERAHLDVTAHADRVRGAARHVDGAVRRHDPGFVLGVARASGLTPHRSADRARDGAARSRTRP